MAQYLKLSVSRFWFDIQPISTHVGKRIETVYIAYEMIIWTEELELPKILLEPLARLAFLMISVHSSKLLSHFSRCLGQFVGGFSDLQNLLHSALQTTSMVAFWKQLYTNLIFFKSPIWRMPQLSRINLFFKGWTQRSPVTITNSMGSESREFLPIRASFVPWRLQILLVRFGALRCLTKVVIPHFFRMGKFTFFRHVSPVCKVLVLWVTFVATISGKIIFSGIKDASFQRLTAMVGKIQNAWYEMARVLLFINGYSRKVSSTRITHNLKLVQVHEYATPSTHFGSWGNLWSENTRFSKKLYRTIHS